MSGKRLQKVFFNADIFTNNQENFRPDSIVVEGNSISWIGNFQDLNISNYNNPEFIDCRNNSLLPGFIDSHMHFLAYCTSLNAINCGSEIVKSIEDLALHLKNNQSNKFWIRGIGYDDSKLSEKRHPNRHDLDKYFPNNPVSIKHRSGHARVLNSKALTISGIDINSIEPTEGIIERDRQGIPTGVFFEMDEYLDSKIPHIETSEFEKLIQEANNKLLSYGITTIHDCTVENSLERYKIFKEREKYLYNKRIRTIFLPGINFFSDFISEKIDDFLSIGQVKIMQTNTTGVNTPNIQELIDSVQNIHKSNFSVAIHAVSDELVYQAAIAIAKVPYTKNSFLPNRIEHASESPKPIIDLIAKSKAYVISNPTFLYSSGDRFIKEISKTNLESLYPFKSFLDNGIPLVFGSDAPVANPNPLIGIYSAMTRTTMSGQKINQSECIDLNSAIRAYTKNASKTSNNIFPVGSLTKNSKADVIVLSQNLRNIPVEEIKNVQVDMTLLNGEIVWSR